MLRQRRSPPEATSMFRTLAMLLLVNILKTAGDCPRVCECKWKSGKESVACINGNVTEIPRSLDSGTQLLDLTGNRLRVIGKDEFLNANLLNLQKIFMSKCKLRTMHRSSFRNIINLVELDLSYNELESIPSHTFGFVTELRELKLNGNPIGRVPNHSFKTVSRLTKLDLSECEIVFIEARAFDGLENSLEWLRLDKNYITNVTPLALTHLGNLHGLELSENPWNCTCRLRPLRQWMLRQNVPYSISPVCRNPSRLAGKDWDKLEADEFACAPKIEAVRPSSRTEEGSNVTLTCSVDGVPEPTVSWVRRNQVIANLSGMASSGGDNLRKLYLVRVSNKTTNLTIMGADTRDNGDYVCRAENKAGKVEASLTLAVSLRVVDKWWTGRMITASAAVVVLFLAFAVLLVACACGNGRRKYVYRRPMANQGRLDSYEMNNKKARNVVYDKIIKKENASDDACNFALVQERQRKADNPQYKVIGGDSDANDEDASHGPADGDLLRRNPTALPATNSRHSSDPEKWPNEYGGQRTHLSPDLHIPRLARDDQWRSDKHPEPLTSLTAVASRLTCKQNPREGGSSLYATLFPSDTIDPAPPKYPDLLDLSLNDASNILNNNNSFCTLPRKDTHHKPRRPRRVSYSSDSQSPLLPGSSGDSCDSGSFSINRRLSAESAAFPKNSSLPTSPRTYMDMSPSVYEAVSPTNYRYESSELEKFLEEYRSLQEQLYKMKESCENLREENLKLKETSRSVESNTISRLVDSPCDSNVVEQSLYNGRHLVGDNFDSVYNGNKILLQEDNNNPKSSSQDGLTTLNDSFWLPRPKVLSTLSEFDPGDPFYQS